MNRTNVAGSLALGWQTALRRRSWVWAALLVLLVTIVYWPTLSNGFTSDDFPYVVNNPALRSAAGLASIWFVPGMTRQYYPLVFSTFWTEYHLWGLDPRGYHIVSLLLHATTAILVWRLLLRLAVPGAWLAAAIFAVHPMEVESVAWVSELKNLLSCALALASILVYLRFSPPEATAEAGLDWPSSGGGRSFYFLSLALYLAAVFSKTVMASVPAILLVIYWWKQGRLTWRDVIPTAPFFAIGWALSSITPLLEKTVVRAVGEEWNLSLVERFLIAGRALGFYVGKLLWPNRLVFFYRRWDIDAHVWWQYLFVLAALAVLVALWLARTRIGRGPLAAALIFVGVLTPALGFFDVYGFRFSFVADHYQYHAGIALIALAVAAAMFVSQALPSETRRFAPWASALLLVPLALAARQRTHVFKDDIILHEDVLAWDSQSWIAHVNLGYAYRDQGRHDEAISHWRKAIEIREPQVRERPAVTAYQDDLAGCHENLAKAQFQAARLAEAEASCRKAIAVREKLVERDPTTAKYQDQLAASWVDAGLLARELGRDAEAEQALSKAIEIRSQLIRDSSAVAEYQENLAETYQTLGGFQQRRGRAIDAAASYRSSIQIMHRLVQENPALPGYRENLASQFANFGALQQTVGRSAEAIVTYHKAIELRQKLAQESPAIASYKADVAANYLEIASLERQRGHDAEAESALRKAIETREQLVKGNPAAAEYRNDMADTYVELGTLQRDHRQFADAELSCRKAIEIQEQLVRDFPAAPEYISGLGWSYANLGVAQLAGDHPKAAVPTCRKAVEVRERLVRDFPDVNDYKVALGWSYANLGAAQLASGQTSDAETSHRTASKIRAQVVEETNLDGHKHELALSFRDLADAQRASGRMSEALASYQKAIEIHEQLAAKYPQNNACQVNLSNDLTPCAEAEALLGKWTESANLYAKAVQAGGYACQLMWRCALVQLAAGNELSYRVTCAELFTRYGNKTATDAVFPIVLTLVAGEKSLDNMNEPLALAERAAEAEPADQVIATLVGIGQYRAGRHKEAITTLAKALKQLSLTSSSAESSDRVLVGRLLGEAILAVAYHEQTGHDIPEKRLAALRQLIDKPEPVAETTSTMPPWIVGFAVEVSKHELARLAPTAETSAVESSSRDK